MQLSKPSSSQAEAPIIQLSWLQPGPALPGLRNFPHEAVLSLESSWPSLAKAKDCQQQDSVPKGSAAQGLPRDHTSTGVTALADLHWSPSPTWKAGKLHGPEISPSALIPHNSESLQAAQHIQQSVSVPGCIYGAGTISSQNNSFLYQFSKPSKARMCVCHQPTSHCMLGISAFSSLRGQDLLSSPPAMGWLFDCVCSKPALQDNHISKFITQAQTASESVKKTLAAGAVGGQRPFPVSITQTGHGLSQ